MFERRRLFGLSVLIGIGGLFAVYVPQTILAEDSDEWPRAVVEHYAEGERPENLERTLVRTVEAELPRARLKPLPRRVSHETDRQPPSEEYLLEHADEVDGELLLAGVYSLSGRRLRLHYRVIDAQRREVLAEAEREGTVDLVLDRMVASLLQDLLKQAEDRLSELRRQRAQVVRSQPPQARPEARGPEEIVPEVPSVGNDRRARRARRLELTVRGNGIISVGEFAPYLPYGYTTDSTLLVWLGEGNMRFGLGGRAGYQHLLPAEEGLAGFVRSFVPLGVDTQLSAWHSNPVSLRLSLTGGAAMRIDDGSTASKRIAAAVPYASAAVGANLALGERFGIGVESAIRSLFHIYREDGESEPQVEPIIGFSPGLSLHYRL